MPETRPPASMEQQLRELRREKLHSLRHDPEIAHALENDSARDLYRLLLKKRKTAGVTERPEIEELLANRRLFAEPIRKPPTMYTLNGVGTSLYGKSEVNESDGTYVATLFFVFVFVPLYPLAQYLVARASGQGWYFLGKVPLNRTARLWRWLTAGGLVAAVCLIAGITYYAETFANLQLVNGLDIPVSIALDRADPIKVPAGSHRTVNGVRKGLHHLTARTARGELIEELNVDVPLAKDVIAYNVVGAAPLYAQGVTYYADGKAPTRADHEQPPTESYCGQRLIVRGRVPYVFTQPEQRISMSSDREMRWRFDLAPGGWRTTVGALAEERKLKEAAAVAVAVARAEPEDEVALECAAGYLRLTDTPDAVLKWLRERTEHAPQSINAHRLLQDAFEQTGRTDENRALYRKLHAEHPDSVMYGYLHARAELPADALRLYAQLVTQHPRDPYVRRGYGHALFQMRRFAEAVRELDQFAALDPQHAIALLRDHARALVALGRTADAIKLVADRCDAALEKGNFEKYSLFLYGRLAGLDPAAAAQRPPETYLRKLLREDAPGPDARLWYLSNVAPGQIDDPLLRAVTNAPLRTAALITRDAPTDPARVLELAAGLPEKELPRIDDPVLLHLACESVRRNDDALAKRLLDAMDIRYGVAALSTNVLHGIEVPELAKLDLELQAVLCVARAQRLRDAGQPTDELYQQALRDDLLHGIATRVVQSSRRGTK